MAVVTDLTLSWSSPVTLAVRERWQARSGTLYISTDAAPSDDDGWLVPAPRWIEIDAGVTVRVRRGVEPAVLIRGET